MKVTESSRVTPLREIDPKLVPRYNTEAEQAVLGAILIANKAYSRVSAFLQPEHFGNAVHGRIFAATGKLIERGQTANPVILKDLFDQDGALAEIGGAQYLARLAANAVTITNAEDYGRVIHDHYLRRRLIAMVEDIADDALRHDFDRPAAAILTDAAKGIAEIERALPRVPAHIPLTVDEWIECDIPRADHLIGELLSTTSRMLLVATTGLGKTNFSMALAFAMAAGHDFLHWRSGRPTRVLYIDGEMSSTLFKRRIEDATRRAGGRPATFFGFCRDSLEKSHYMEMRSLNTAEGQHFIEALIKRLGGVDFIIFDNIQSLLSGSMLEEEPWGETLPWIRALTGQRIGQLWIDHTGHNETRSYGTKTKEWQMDIVAILQRNKESAADIAFTIEFTKARERTPENRSDFAKVTITLDQDQWTVAGVENAKPRKSLSPLARKFHDALGDALAHCGKPRSESASRPSVTKLEWEAECVRLGLVDNDNPDSKRSLLSKYRRELLAANSVGCNGNYLWQIT